MTNDINKKDLIQVRKYSPESDRNFILATFLRGLYYGDSWFRDIPKDIFMDKYHTVVEHILAKSTIEISCLREDPEVILGYSVFELDPINGNILHWVFVKSAWRKIGICKSLVPSTIKVVTHLTKIGKALKPVNVDFNPFVI